MLPYQPKKRHLNPSSIVTSYRFLISQCILACPSILLSSCRRSSVRITSIAGLGQRICLELPNRDTHLDKLLTKLLQHRQDKHLLRLDLLTRSLRATERGSIPLLLPVANSGSSERALDVDESGNEVEGRSGGVLRRRFEELNICKAAEGYDDNPSTKLHTKEE